MEVRAGEGQGGVSERHSPETGQGHRLMAGLGVGVELRRERGGARWGCTHVLGGPILEVDVYYNVTRPY